MHAWMEFGVFGVLGLFGAIGGARIFEIFGVFEIFEGLVVYKGLGILGVVRVLTEVIWGFWRTRNIGRVLEVFGGFGIFWGV